MNKCLLPLVGLFASLSAVVASASDLCEVPEAEWQPIEELQARLEEQGWTIRNMKVDDGCYEAYALDENGGRVEAYFNPKTFELIKSK